MKNALDPLFKKYVVAQLNPNTRKRERGKGEREASRQGRRIFSGTPFAMRRGTGAMRRGTGSSAHFTPDPLSSCHETCHAMKPVPSAPLCRYCAQIDPFLLQRRSNYSGVQTTAAFKYSGVQNVVPIDGAIRLSQAADDVPNPVGDRPGGRLCDVIPRDSHPQIPRPDLLTPLNPQTNELRMGAPTTEGEDFRQPPFNPEPIVVIALDGELDGISCHQSFRTPPGGAGGT